MKTFAAFVVFASALQVQGLPPRLTAGAPVEICGRVAAFVSDTPAKCDASLTVTSGASSTTVVIPGSARRGASSGRELEGAEACFSGLVELEPRGVSRVRIPSFDAIRVATPAASPAFGAGASDACVDSGVTLPRVLHDVRPQYPSRPMTAQIQGGVTLEAVVNASGEVTATRVTRPLDPELDQASLRALREWRFAPGTDEGAVPVIINVEMTFSLRPRR
jgi:TonB family protein